MLDRTCLLVETAFVLPAPIDVLCALVTWAAHFYVPYHARSVLVLLLLSHTL
jgi:hypothetical protein